MLDTGPSGMSIDAASGLIEWAPDNTHVAATNAVTVTATDTGGLSDSQTFDIAVAAAN